MKTEVLILKIIKKHNASSWKRFLCSPEDFKNLIRERKVNVFGQVVSHVDISVRPESGVLLGNIVHDSVTLN